MTPFNADVEVLRQTRKQVHELSDAMRSELSATESALDSAASGWVGASAAALTAKRQEWADRTAKRHNTLSKHADSFGSAADQFEAMESNNTRNMQEFIPIQGRSR